MQRHNLCTHEHRASLWDVDTLKKDKKKRLTGYQMMYSWSLKFFSFLYGFCRKVWTLTALHSGSPGMDLLPYRKVKAALWDGYFSTSERLLVVSIWRVRGTRFGGLGEQDLNIKTVCWLMLFQIQQEQKRSKSECALGCPNPELATAHECSSLHPTPSVTGAGKYRTHTKLCTQPFCSLLSFLFSTSMKGWRKAVENTRMQLQGH